MHHPPVIFLGGAPMVGKTTVARIIAQRLGYMCISTDDFGAAIAAVTTPATHPAFHYMGGLDHHEYYISRDVDELVEDIDACHEALWPAVEIVVRHHSTWAQPAIIEGWALRPDYVAHLAGNVAGLFLLCDDALIEQRVRANPFSEGASDRELMISRYLHRSIRYSAHLRERVSALRLHSIGINAEMRPEEIADGCLELLGLAAKGP